MVRRMFSLIIFLMAIVAYIILPFLLIRDYVTPPEKKALFMEAMDWKDKEPEAIAEFEKERAKINSDAKLSEEERRLKIVILKREYEAKSPFFKKGKSFHQRLLNMGVTPDVPILVGIYFFVGVLLFWLYRLRAKRAGVLAGKLQYTFYLFVLSILIIITTFGFGFTATYIYNSHWWQLQHPIEEFSTPLQETPFIATHFISFALNAAAMGPFDHYMTVRPNSLQISLMQWIERLFVISVLFSSISRLWWHPAVEEEEEEASDSPTLI